MARGQGISGVAVGVMGAGALLMWAGLKGASVAEILQDLVKGQQPKTTNIRGIESKVQTNAPAAAATANTPFAELAPPSSRAARILEVAASKKGWCYLFGGGHGGGNPCNARCVDCSGYVSCVLTTVLGRQISMTTAGLAGIGTGVPYAQRQPGDILVWNGGAGGGHTGIIATVSGKGGTMWDNLCTGCGGVAIHRYPSGTRTAAAAVVRRV